MRNEHIMLKWIKNRTRRMSAPTGGEFSCITSFKESSECEENLKPLNNQVCPLCRATKTTEDELSLCMCGQVNLDSSGIIDFDTIKRQTRRVNSVSIKNNLKAALSPTTYLIPKGSPLCRSRSDVTGLKYTPIQRDFTKRLSPRSRAPILNPAEFAELSSEDESSGYGDSECSGNSQSGYSSDESLKTLLQSMVIKPSAMLDQSPTVSPCASPVPKMGCKAVIQRSSSANGRRDLTKKVALRSQSLNRAVKPVCGIKRSRSRATSFRKEQVEFSISVKDDCGSGYLDNHIDQLAQIRTELQNLYALDRN